MAETAVKTKEDAADVAVFETPRMVEPGSLVAQGGGYSWMHYVLRMPEGWTLDDLREPRVWSQFQKRNGNPLRKWDRLTAFSWDDTQMADAVVTDANGEAVAFHWSRVVAAENLKPLFQDETYSVKWYGSGFAVSRNTDKQRVTELVGSEALAIRDLKNMYKKAA